MNHINNKGVALVELALVLPFFLVILLGIIDVSMTIKKSQYLSVAVREIGNNAYRQCKEANNGTATDNCLKTSVNESISFFSAKDSPLNGFQLVVKSWEVKQSKGFAVAPSLKGSYSLGSAFTSKYTSNIVLNLNSYDANLRKTLITVEILLDNSKTPFFNFKRTLYDTTIF